MGGSSLVDDYSVLLGIWHHFVSFHVNIEVNWCGHSVTILVCLLL